mgnify:CR=1 FL=1
MRRLYLGLGGVALTTLAFETLLTRIFSLAQGYHFAFMVVSIALLGYGVSGTLLALWPALLRGDLRRRLSRLALAFTASLVAAYLFVNLLPFDSYRIAWDRRQAFLLAGHYLALAVPFLLSGLMVALLLARFPDRAFRVYGANMAGSALGCLVVPLLLPFLGAAGTLVVIALAGWLAGCILAWRPGWWEGLGWGAGGLFLVALLAFGPRWMEVRLSPYKGLSQALLHPEARVVFSQWNAFSRVDVVAGSGFRSAPGLSAAFRGVPPAQWSLFVDGDARSPISGEPRPDLPPGSWEALDHLPVVLPFRLRPGAQTLVLEPRGGLDLLVALRQGAENITAVEGNPLTVEAVWKMLGGSADNPYRDPRVQTVLQEGRSFLHRTSEQYDVVLVSLADPFRPVTSGAYSLSENYTYTVQAMQEAYRRLRPGGILVLHRWLQWPPSESVRAGALLVEALEGLGVSAPGSRLAVLQTWSTALLMVREAAWTSEELADIRQFAEAMQYDLVYLPDMRPEEVNRFARYDEPAYYLAFQSLVEGVDRRAFYQDSAFDVRPPTDDWPFFFHFFRWRQTPEVLRSLGHTWQPFGGSGYFVLVALLILAVVAAACCILLPLALGRGLGKGGRVGVSLYFGALGLGFLFVEIPLLQRFILFLDQPIYAFVVVLFSLLLFSGLGSLVSQRLPWRGTLWALAAAVLVAPYGFALGIEGMLGWPLLARVAAACGMLAPLGFAMGLPFPRGIAALEARSPGAIPWAWAINGSLSVVASILAPMVAMSWGFRWVVWAGAACYALAGMVGPRLRGAED